MNANAEGPSEELELQITRGSYFTHTALTQQAQRLNESEAFLYGLLDLLMEKGLVKEEELQAKVEAVRKEVNAKAEQFTTGVLLRRDPETPAVEPQINCAERLHICKAACCRLSFALSVNDLEGGKVKWDLGKPYFIRHTSNGRCVHLDQGNCQCGVYNDRPRVCRTYSCVHDKRIWKDFEKMELNEEWIEGHLSGERLVLEAIYMGDQNSQNEQNS